MLNYSVHLCYHLQLGHIMCYFNENHNTPKNVLSITFQNLHGNITYKQQQHSRNELARPVMGTIFLVIIIGERAKRARHSQVCSIENRDIYIIVRTYVTFAL